MQIISEYGHLDFIGNIICGTSVSDLEYRYSPYSLEYPLWNNIHTYSILSKISGNELTFFGGVLGKEHKLGKEERGRQGGLKGVKDVAIFQETMSNSPFERDYNLISLRLFPATIGS